MKGKFFFFFFLIFILSAGNNSFAVKYTTATTNTEVLQLHGPVEDGDTDQKLLRIKLEVITGGAVTPVVNTMTLTVTGWDQMTNIYLYTSDQNATFTSTTLLSTVVPSSGTVVFTTAGTNTDAATGYHYYWVVFDAIGTVDPGAIIDAAYVGGTYATGPPAFTTTDPSGYRKASRYFTIGSGQDYATLGAVATAIRNFYYDDDADTIFMELTGYADPAESAMTFTTSLSGAAPIVIRPQSATGPFVTAGDPGDGVAFITLSGASKIIFDGRPGGTGTTIQWSIRNSRTADFPAEVFKFINSASNNKLTWLYLEAENRTTVEAGGVIGIGIVGFSTSTAGTGNNNNTISYCHFRDLTGGTGAKPQRGLVSQGASGFSNTGNIIDNCQFYGIFGSTTNVWSLINLPNYNSSWTISNNHFYQTGGTYTGTANADLHNVITIGSIGTAGSGGAGPYTITGNYIGGQDVSCGGNAMNLSNLLATYIGLAEISSGTTSSISNNTISNISSITTYTGTANVRPAFMG